MNSYVLGLEEIDRTKLAVVGGKASNLGDLSRLEGIRVPRGFCVTADAYKRTVGRNEEVDALLDRLSVLKVADRGRIAEISRNIRRVIEGIDIPCDIARAIIRHLAELGEDTAYCVRSSATAEDLPLASFAGQHDTYLNIKGTDAILQYVSRCWASLFTDRAVIYRIQNGFGHRRVYMCVVVQRMVSPEASGIMFTADPSTSNRRVLSIDAGFGLGEALVSGLVNPDVYKVREGRIVHKKISTKKMAVYALDDGGTEEREIEPGRQNRQTLRDEQILRLEGMGRQIEAYFACPQDIEWCVNWAESSGAHSPVPGRGGSPTRSDVFYIVQSRPITTLFPIPEHDGLLRVYVSVGHQQMMTDAIRPLGMSIFGFLYHGMPFHTAAGRPFLDLSHDLASPGGRKIVLSRLGDSDPLMKNAIVSLTRRKNFIKSLQRGQGGREKSVVNWGPRRRSGAMRVQPAIIEDLIARSEVSITDLRQRVANVSGEKLFALILQDHEELKEILLDPRSLAAIGAGTSASRWLNGNMEKWLGEKGVADTLSQSVANNVTSEMGLALLDVADVVRQHPAVIEYLRHPNGATLFDDLAKLAGGDAVSRSLRAYLEKYGMRCSGEIDITRTRWSEQPTALIPILLSNIKNCEPNARAIKFDEGRQEAEQKERELLSRLERLPDGKRKVKETKKMIGVLRSFIGYREYPKYALIRRYWIYKQALLQEASLLVRGGVLRQKEDIYYLSFEELREVVRTKKLDYSVITRRKEEYDVYDRLMPPRVMTSEGEVVSGECLNRDAPRGALAGIPASAGIIEGRARVLLKMEDAAVEHGDILVTRFTDPSWTPAFVSVEGVVTEVGGLMSHGAVIAREYGLPAVVGVDDATTLIEDGQTIRVNGTEGYVEVL